MNVSEFKKVVFIENEDWASMKHTPIQNIYKDLTSQGVECVVIERASGKKAEVFKAVNESDAIFFASTFLYKEEVKGIGDLLKAVKDPKMIFGWTMNSGKDLAASIESIWDVYEMVQFSHHRIFEILHRRIEENNDWYHELDMTLYAKEVAALEEERIKRNAGFKRLKTKVLIKKIQAVGPEWSLLKEGDIVDELDCSEIDDCPRRGIWVMGKTEPIKLLNDSGYDEWEYVNPNCFDLANEFFSRGGVNDESHRDLKELIADYIGKCTGKLKMNEIELWDFCDRLCKQVKVERRGNRHYFQRRLNEHRERFVYFKDPACCR
jgi:hypothetical protein